MGKFTADLRAFEGRTEAKADKIVLLFVLEARTRIIVRTPVDTGRARANWQYGFGSAPSGEIAGADKSGSSASARIAGQIPAKAAGGVHYIVNNLSYIQSLEDGGSTQAPAGMVGVTLAEADQILQRAVAAAGL